MELTPKEQAILKWLKYTPGGEGVVCTAWTEPAAQLSALGLVELVGNHGGLIASLTPGGVAYLNALDDDNG